MAAPSSARGDDPGDDLEGILGGFEDEEEAPAHEAAPTPAAAAAASRFWDVSGSVNLASSINYLHHRSVTGTTYTGLQKLRARLNLQLDLDLPRKWKARFAGYGFHDFAYRIQGRSRYTDEVLDQARDLAEQLVDFMLSQRFQEDIPLNMFVFPANSQAGLPEVFAAHAANVRARVDCRRHSASRNRAYASSSARRFSFRTRS